MLLAISGILLACCFFIISESTFILIVLYVNTVTNVMFEPASAALIPLIVERGNLQKAYSIFSVVRKTIKERKFDG